MSHDDRDHEELRRRLADQGPARAPGDLASEVMRRVRAEPRRRPRRSLRPVLIPLVAALLAAAGLIGVSRLGGGGAAGLGAGSTSSRGALGALPSTSPAPANGEAAKRAAVVRAVPLATAERLLGYQLACSSRLSAYVPDALYDSVMQGLRHGAAQYPSATSPKLDVYLRHAPKTQTRIRVTCP